MSDRARQSDRRSQFKKVIDAEDGRRRRSDNTVLLRKSKREESIMKRRQLVQSASAADADTPTSVDAGSSTPSRDALASDESRAHLVSQLNSSDLTEALAATRAFRKLLSLERNPPITEVVALGVVPKFVEFLAADDATDLQFEAAWCLTNIASGETDHTTAVIKAPGAIHQFVRLLQSPHENLRDQCVWALGNIAGDGPQQRDLVIAAGAIDGFLMQFYDGAGQAIIRNTTWALSNLCRGKPATPLSTVARAIPVLAQLVQFPDDEVVADASWAISYITDGENQRIEPVVETPGLVERLVSLLNHSSKAIQTPVLRTVGNIVTGSEMQTEAVVRCNPFPALLSLMASSKRTISKEACWALSNITAGTVSQATAAVNAGCIPAATTLLSNGTYEVQKEATWAISNACCTLPAEVLMTFVTEDLLAGLVEVMSKKTSDAKIVSVALEAVANLLKAGAVGVDSLDDNRVAQVLEEVGGLDVIEDLQDSKSDEVYNHAVTILETYFPTEGEDDAVPDAAFGVENANGVPAPQAAGKAFQFGAQPFAPTEAASFAF